MAVGGDDNVLHKMVVALITEKKKKVRQHSCQVKRKIEECDFRGDVGGRNTLRAFFGNPNFCSSRVSCQTMIVLSLEAERIMSGFSDEVANAVTQPLWPITHKLERDRRDKTGICCIPWSVPLKTRLSAMLCERRKGGCEREVRFVMCARLHYKIAVTLVLRTSWQYRGYPNLCNRGIDIIAP